MPSYLEQRYQTWYAALTIPAELRAHFGKRRFFQSLETPVKTLAAERVLRVVADWKAQIRSARQPIDIVNAFEGEAVNWHKELLATRGDPDTQALLKGLLGDRAQVLEETHGADTAQSFYGIASGKRTPSDLYFEAWKIQLNLKPKTCEQMARDVRLLIDHFPTLEDITKGAVKVWTNEMTGAGRSVRTQARILSFCRNYWRYLQQHDAIALENTPLERVLDYRQVKAADKDDDRQPFTAQQVVDIWQKAGQTGDYQLADLIRLAAYTGARIEELCSLQLSQITDEAIEVKAAKTRSGNRSIPIHPDIAPLVSRLKKASSDGFLISGLSLNKYNDRSNAIGKRFGRLKTAMKFSEKYVFHSIRKTFTTQLENTAVLENIAADILGHKKPHMSYGLYSGGASLQTKAGAIAHVSYPFPVIDEPA